VKSQDIKYRTLKLDNPKLSQKLLFFAKEVMELLEGTCGFVSTCSSGSDDGGANNILQLATPPSDFTRSSILMPLLQAIGVGLAQLNNSGSTTTTSSDPAITLTNKKPRITTIAPVEEQLTGKQKARRLLEQTELLEKQKTKEHRQRQLKLLKQDKLTRETDPNWKPGLSAACAKSGSSISTFRDKYGEN
jgi:hypothetical protein